MVSIHLSLNGSLFSTFFFFQSFIVPGGWRLIVQIWSGGKSLFITGYLWNARISSDRIWIFWGSPWIISNVSWQHWLFPSLSMINNPFLVDNPNISQSNNYVFALFEKVSSFLWSWFFPRRHMSRYVEVYWLKDFLFKGKLVTLCH